VTTTPNAIDLSTVRWRTSTRSSSGGANCVEAGPFVDGSRRYAVRDSKDRAGGILVVTAGAWNAFLGVIRYGGVGPAGEQR